MKPELSIVIPIFNEEESIAELIRQINEAISKKHTFEIVFVDDGSTDSTLELLKKYSRDYKNIHVHSFRKNLGKANALTYGFSKSNGKYIVTMDADLQDDPQNIEKMLNYLLAHDHDLVSGWRKTRKDSGLKKINSRFFNKVIIPFLFNVNFNDMNSGLKIYKSHAAKSLKIYGGMHRFIPVLASQMGYKVAEVEITHHPRKYGYSKFKSTKVLTDIPDLLTMFFLVKYNNRPLHLFSLLGGTLLFLGGIILLYLTIVKIMGEAIGGRPLLIFGVLFFVAGLQTIFTGLLADLMINLNRGKNDDEFPVKYNS